MFCCVFRRSFVPRWICECFFEMRHWIWFEFFFCCWLVLVLVFFWLSMLLPTNSSAPIGFQQDYYELPEKTKYLTTRCVSNSRNSKSPVREKSYDTLKRNRFRFCVCTGPRRNKKSTKWYVKVRGMKTHEFWMRILHFEVKNNRLIAFSRLKIFQ